MRIIIEDNQNVITCKVSMRVGKSSHNIACNTYVSCDRKTKERVKAVLTALLIRISNGQLEEQTQELLEGLVLEQRRQGEGTIFEESNTTEKI